jgi:hypothetical protein
MGLRFGTATVEVVAGMRVAPGVGPLVPAAGPCEERGSPAGVGPWQEIYDLLREFVARLAPVIPVLLDNAPSTPEVPSFLRAMTYADFRDPVVRPEWGRSGRTTPDG